MTGDTGRLDDTEEDDMDGMCAACGQPGHRYGRNEGIDRFDRQACINVLNGEIARLKDADLYREGWDDAVKAALNAWDA